MALWAGLGLWLVTSLVVSARFALLFTGAESGWDSTINVLRRWNLLQSALPFGCLALAAAGAFELCRRTTGRSKRGAQLMAGALLVILGAKAVSAYCAWSSAAQPENLALHGLWTWTHRIGATAWLVLGAGVVAAGWQVRAVRWLAVPLLFATLLAHPYDGYAKALYEALGGDASRAGTWMLRGGLELVWAALILLALSLAPPLTDGSEGWPRVAQGLERTSRALYGRLAISILGALLTLIVFLWRGGTPAMLREASELWVPLASVIATIVAVTGILGAGGLTAPGAPRRLLYAAAALTATTLVLTALKVFLLHRGRGNEEALALATALPLILPAMSFVAMVLLVQGLFRLAELLPDLTAREQAWKSRNTVIFGSAVGLGAPFLAHLSLQATWHAQLFWVLVAAIASLLAQASMALLCRVLADELRQRAELPAAQVLRR
jgi:lipid-A-disaccharide synthase-like uncharacterized protein